MSDIKIKVHIKNNHFGPHTFPNTPEGERTFTITEERYRATADKYPEVSDCLEVFVDWDLDHFTESMRAAEVLICWDFPTESLTDIAPHLKWIHVIGAGVEHLLPMDWMPVDLILTNNKGVHAVKGGEYGLMSILMLHNSIPAFSTFQRERVYNSIYSTPIAGKVLLIIGVGSIGGAVAGLAKSLNVKVLGISKHGRMHPHVDEMFSVEKLDEVLPLADYVFVSTPLTPETDNLLNRKRLNLMKKDSGLINVGRAAVVDYDALAEQLETGHLSGAVLDVFESEPLPQDSKLWSIRNLMITPHVSADDGDSYVAQTLQLFFENMQRYLEGLPLQNQVRPELGY